MMIYQYRCLNEDCDHVSEALRDIDARNECPPCDLCEQATKKIISQYSTHSDLTPYFDDNLGKFIESKQHRRKVMKDQGVSENFGQGWHTSAVKKRRQD
jgi:hypothetical protein